VVQSASTVIFAKSPNVIDAFSFSLEFLIATRKNLTSQKDSEMTVWLDTSELKSGDKWNWPAQDFACLFRNAAENGAIMKYFRFCNFRAVSGYIFPLVLVACAQTHSQSVETSETHTCVNGVCTSTTTETRTSKTGVNGTNVSVGTNVNTGGVVTIGGGTSVSGGVSLSPCTPTWAPVSACSAAGEGGVISPKHLGCTATGNHAWSCQDSFSGAPPYAVVSCSGAFSDTCAKIGQIY
jgi:hypothetical protein